jgi:hypothetical protein
MHRQIMGFPRAEVDHRNRNRVDNRRQNLRVATRQQNGENCSAHGDARSAYRGVSWDKRRRKWVARTSVRGRVLQRYCATELEAASVAADFRREHMPFSDHDRRPDAAA